MNRLGLKTLIFHGDLCLGEVEIFSTRNQNFQFPNNEIRITHITQPSERCPPLSILQTISPFTVRCKLKSSSLAEMSHLNTLYFSCLHERQTAVVVLGGEELHLVAMPSKQEKLPCFWCCSVPIGLYGSCLGMLNLRCLAIVFDLDETLIVANTMKSFEDRIEFLQKRLEDENDPLRISGMSAELRRYVEDRSLLKQYTENDNVMDSGKLYPVQLEEVQSLSNDQEKIVRPIIRLKERNIVLTRINPEIRDTSVLVRLRPAWEEIRSYLNAKGRKRFEVYVCTMAERDYALEMWRLLDPDAHLISSNQLLNRVVCVKSGSRKSLPGVFQSGMCHPKMAMVIDDRQKVWEDSDQPRVHVVPAFTPYYAPQAETAHVVPVLCVARNVACNVRAGFFKEFDENLLGKIFELCYEDEVASLPYSPDVSDFLMAEDTVFVPNGNKDLPIAEGMNGAEVEQRMNKVDEKHRLDLESPFVTKNPELKPEASQLPVLISPDVGSSETSRTEFPFLKSGLPEASPGMEANPSDFDPEKKRRHYTLQHGQDIGKQNPTIPLLSRLSTNVSLPSIKSSGGWLVEEDQNPTIPLLSRLSTNVSLPSIKSSGGWLVEEDQIDNGAAGPTQQFDASQDKQQAHQNLTCSKTESILSGPSSHVAEVKSEEAYGRHKTKQHNHSQLNQSFLTEGEISINQASASNKELQVEAQKFVQLPSYIYIGVLQEIGRKCGSKVEFRSVVSTSKDLQFSVEVLFAGDKIGAGMGKTKKDAQQQAAENALRTLADEYEEYARSDSGPVGINSSKDSLSNENGILWDDPHDELPLKDALSIARTSEAGRGANGSLKSLGTQETHKRANSPRSEESSQNKKLKGEVVPGFR